MRVTERGIGIVVLAVLMVLPASGTLCAMLCDTSASTSAAHHGASQDCEQGSPSASSVRIHGFSGHDCRTHGAATLETASIAAARADGIAASPLQPTAAAHLADRVLTRSESFFDYQPPLNDPRLIAGPLVLRI